MRDGELTLGEQNFIESFGLFAVQVGMSRIGGRMQGLLLLADQPLSLEEIADLLLVSPASVSTNARLLVASGAIQRDSLPGDRRTYFTFSPHAWERRLQASVATLQSLRAITQRGLAEIGEEDDVEHERLADLLDFCDFYAELTNEIIERWRERHQRRQALARMNGAARLGGQPAVEETGHGDAD